MLNSSDPDLDRQNVDSDLGAHCLHRLSAEDEIFMLKLPSVVFFFSNKLFQKILSGTLSECQTVLVQIRTVVQLTTKGKHG